MIHSGFSGMTRFLFLWQIEQIPLRVEFLLKFKSGGFTAARPPRDVHDYDLCQSDICIELMHPSHATNNPDK